jgi:hypothetical protein
MLFPIVGVANSLEPAPNEKAQGLGFRVQGITVVSKRLEPSRTSRYMCPPFLTTIISQELMQRGAAMRAPSARSVVKIEPGLQPPAIFAITGSSEAAR